LAESLLHQTGRPAGFKPFHIVVAAALGVVWIGLTVFALSNGRGEQSSVDVYSQLPADFTGQLLAQGVQYQGLSSVDATTQNRVLALPGSSGSGAVGSSPLVFRTSFTDTKKPRHGGPSYSGRAAIMIVVPDAQSSTSGTKVFVELVDPTTYKVLRTVSYGGASASVPPSPSG
jgi:hypothetical protein